MEENRKYWTSTYHPQLRFPLSPVTAYTMAPTITLKVFLVLTAALFPLEASSVKCPDYPDCDLDYACNNDGWCDAECNNAENNYDGGDCCDSTCAHGLAYECGPSDDFVGGKPGYDCKDPQAESSCGMERGVADQYKIRAEYRGFTLWQQCNKSRNAGYTLRYSYTLERDTHNYERKKSGPYFRDNEIPWECQQSNGETYFDYNGEKYDLGHVVMADHLDSKKESMYDGHYAANILPQARRFNQGGGAYRAIEDMVNEARDHSTIEKIINFGGMTYDNASNDGFLQSHGIPTPDIYWRVAVRVFKNGSKADVTSWIMANKFSSKTKKGKGNSTSNQLFVKMERGGFLAKVSDIKSYDSLGNLFELDQFPDYTEFRLGWDYPQTAEPETKETYSHWSKSVDITKDRSYKIVSDDGEVVEVCTGT